MNILLTLFLIFLNLFITGLPRAVLAAFGNVQINALVPGCGDGIIQTGEECDSSNLNGASCISQGFSGGTLSCSASCSFNTSACNFAPPSSSGGGGGGRRILTSTPIPTLPNLGVIDSAQAKLIDIQRDGVINILDFNAMMVNWGSTANLASAGSVFNIADMNHDGVVDILDFNILMVYWGITYQL